jgi:hypothetical protein
MEAGGSEPVAWKWAPHKPAPPSAELQTLLAARRRREAAAAAAPSAPSVGASLPAVWDEGKLLKEWPRGAQYDDPENERSLPGSLRASLGGWTRLGELASGATSLYAAPEPPQLPPPSPSAAAGKKAGASAAPGKKGPQWPARSFAGVELAGAAARDRVWGAALQAALNLQGQRAGAVAEGALLWEAILPRHPTSLCPALAADARYAVRLFVQGAWRAVIVDDRVPVDAEGAPLLPRSRRAGELWPFIVAKALLKATAGCADEPALVLPALVQCLTGLAPLPDATWPAPAPALLLNGDPAAQAATYLSESKAVDLASLSEAPRPEALPPGATQWLLREVEGNALLERAWPRAGAYVFWLCVGVAQQSGSAVWLRVDSSDEFEVRVEELDLATGAKALRLALAQPRMRVAPALLRLEASASPRILLCSLTRAAGAKGFFAVHAVSDRALWTATLDATEPQDPLWARLGLFCQQRRLRVSSPPAAEWQLLCKETVTVQQQSEAPVHLSLQFDDPELARVARVDVTNNATGACSAVLLPDGSPLALAAGAAGHTIAVHAVGIALKDSAVTLRVVAATPLAMASDALTASWTHAGVYESNHHRIVFRELLTGEGKGAVAAGLSVSASDPGARLVLQGWDLAAVERAPEKQLMSLERVASPLFVHRATGLCVVPHLALSKERRVLLQLSLDAEPSAPLRWALQVCASGPVALATDASLAERHAQLKLSWEKRAPGRKKLAAQKRSAALQSAPKPLACAPLEVGDAAQAAVLDEAAAASLRRAREQAVQEREAHLQHMRSRREAERRAFESRCEAKRAEAKLEDCEAAIAEATQARLAHGAAVFAAQTAFCDAEALVAAAAALPPPPPLASGEEEVEGKKKPAAKKAAASDELQWEGQAIEAAEKLLTSAQSLAEGAAPPKALIRRHEQVLTALRDAADAVCEQLLRRVAALHAAGKPTAQTVLQRVDEMRARRKVPSFRVDAWRDAVGALVAQQPLAK